eukprot:TRINITY_DN2372_c0_g1_i1.p1 TRINITY_DN2372_c0_g1~~TRINITY_DN2372_c0_g1_i1.p1  ORF type:complete len:381 (+),score=57.03 TRINITY_DN2372_c0_g1_i1:68-1144(+)
MDDGLYADKITDAMKPEQTMGTSVGANGLGLVNLALQHAIATWMQPTLQTTEHVQKFLQTIDAVANLPRCDSTHWFAHWVKFQGASPGDKLEFSTVDTALFFAGALLAARYFDSRGFPAPLQRVTTLLKRVKWASAIHDVKAGTLYMTFSEKGDGLATTHACFNEYIVVAQMGMYAEYLQGQPGGPMTAFWQQHFAHPRDLPQKKFCGALPLLTYDSGLFASSFWIQYAMYLCGDVNHHNDYWAFYRNAAAADQRYGEIMTSDMNDRRHGLWGQGAGSVHGHESRYYACAIQDLQAGESAHDARVRTNFHASAPIVAGFLPVYPNGIRDLAKFRNWAASGVPWRVRHARHPDGAHGVG